MFRRKGRGDRRQLRESRGWQDPSARNAVSSPLGAAAEEKKREKCLWSRARTGDSARVSIQLSSGARVVIFLTSLSILSTAPPPESTLPCCRLACAFHVVGADKGLSLRCLSDRVGRDDKGAPVIVCNHTTERMSEIRGSIHRKEARRSNTKGKEGQSSNGSWGDDGGFRDVPEGKGGMISRTQSAGSIKYRPSLSGFPRRAGPGSSASGGAAAAAAAAGSGGGEFGRTSSAGSGASCADGGAREFGRTSSEASKSSERGSIERAGSAGWGIERVGSAGGGIERVGSAGSSKSGMRNQKIKGGGAGAEFGRSSSAGSVRTTATARSSGRSIHGVEDKGGPGAFLSAQDDMERRLDKVGLSERARTEMRAKEKVPAPAPSSTNLPALSPSPPPFSTKGACSCSLSSNLWQL